MRVLQPLAPVIYSTPRTGQSPSTKPLAIRRVECSSSGCAASLPRPPRLAQHGPQVGDAGLGVFLGHRLG